MYWWISNFLDEAKEFTLEEISAIAKALPDEKFIVIPSDFKAKDAIIRIELKKY